MEGIRSEHNDVAVSAGGHSLADGAQFATKIGGKGATMFDMNSLVVSAYRIAGAVDRGLLGDLWNGSSRVMKDSLDRDAFVQAIESIRRSSGTVIERQWAAISRHHSAGQAAPEGIYVNVEFDVLVESGQRRAELLSLRLEEKGAWRLTGYLMR